MKDFSFRVNGRVLKGKSRFDLNDGSRASNSRNLKSN
jgi:hypothetical protein